jgi:uncharacterized membrane protein YciS (DUF1049 family)
LSRILRWAIGLPLVLYVIGFAIANRQRVTISFNPLAPGSSFSSFELPLWLLFFAGLIVGVVAGWTGCWLAQGKYRKLARDAQSEAGRLRSENASLAAAAKATSDAEGAQDKQIVPMGSVGWL